MSCQSDTPYCDSCHAKFIADPQNFKPCKKCIENLKDFCWVCMSNVEGTEDGCCPECMSNSRTCPICESDPSEWMTDDDSNMTICTECGHKWYSD